MNYEPIISKILGKHTKREGEVASLVLSYVDKHHLWKKENIALCDERAIEAVVYGLQKVYGEGVDYFLSPSRDTLMVTGRQMICLFLRQEAGMTLQRIADILGRNHASVLWCIRQAGERNNYEKAFQHSYETFKNYCLEKI